MSINTKKIYHLSGLSTDTKPIPDDIATGSTFLETDTGITFVYNRGTNQWIPTKEKVEPTTTTPCLGILSIELTSRAGLVDTYTIRYTNGSSTTFNVTNGGYVTPNIDEPNPIISDKVYSLDINTDKYELYKAVRLSSVYSADPNVVKSEVINYQTFWPRLDEGKFILALTADTELVFSYVGTYDGVETWQAVEIADVNTIIRYIGHFEYADNKNQNSSNYYFVAARQILSIDKELAEEVARAQNAELELSNRIEAHQEEYEALTERLSIEEARAIAQDLELETKIEQVVAGLENKVDKADFDQEIVANKLDARSVVLFGDKESAVSKKVATIGAEIDGANRTLAIYQEIIEDEKLPVENIDINAENITINANNTAIEGMTTINNAIVSTATITAATIDSATINSNIMFNTITEKYLDELFPIIQIEDQGE